YRPCRCRRRSSVRGGRLLRVLALWSDETGRSAAATALRTHRYAMPWTSPASQALCHTRVTHEKPEAAAERKGETRVIPASLRAVQQSRVSRTRASTQLSRATNTLRAEVRWSRARPSSFEQFSEHRRRKQRLSIHGAHSDHREVVLLQVPRMADGLVDRHDALAIRLSNPGGPCHQVVRRLVDAIHQLEECVAAAAHPYVRLPVLLRQATQWADPLRKFAALAEQRNPPEMIA